MKYRVIYTEKFYENIDAHIDYLLSEYVEMDVIAQWYDRLFARLDRLDENPKRLAADEAQSKIHVREIRKVNFEKYIVFYHVDEALAEVQVLAFMHGAGRKEG